MPTVDRASRDGQSIWMSAMPCLRCRGPMWTDGKVYWCIEICRGPLWTDGEVAWFSDFRCDPLPYAPVETPTKGSR